MLNLKNAQSKVMGQQEQQELINAIVQTNAGSSSEIKRLLKQHKWTYTKIQRNIEVKYIVRGKDIAGKIEVKI